MHRLALLLIAMVFPTVSLAAEKVTPLLTEQEEQWLEEHRQLRIVPDPAYPPIEFFDNGGYTGMAADFMERLEEILGIEFIVIEKEQWDESLRALRNREGDLLPAASITPQRRRYLNFTAPYIENPVVLLTRQNVKPALTLETLGANRLGVTEGYAETDFLTLTYPEISLQTYPTVARGMEALALGGIDYFAANLATISALIDELGLTNLRVVERTEFSHKLTIGVRSDWPLLPQILEKGLAAIPEDEKTEIYRRWIKAETDPFILSRRVILILLAAAAVILAAAGLILIWNRSLAVQVRKKTAELQQELEENARQRRELEESNEVKAFLLREVHHRVNNNLQLILSLLSLGRKERSGREVEDVLLRFESRISVIALAHESVMLNMEERELDIRTFTLNALSNAKNILDAPQDFRLQHSGEPRKVPLRLAIDYGLFLNEVSVNFLLARKAAGDTGGAMEVRLHCGEERALTLEIHFQGGEGDLEGIKGPPGSLSRDLISGMLTRMDAAWEQPGGGNRLTVRVPLSPEGSTIRRKEAP